MKGRRSRLRLNDMVDIARVLCAIHHVDLTGVVCPFEGGAADAAVDLDACVMPVADANHKDTAVRDICRDIKATQTVQVARVATLGLCATVRHDPEFVAPPQREVPGVAALEMSPAVANLHEGHAIGCLVGKLQGGRIINNGVEWDRQYVSHLVSDGVR